MTDLKLRPGTPNESLYRVSGSLRPNPLAGIDACRWYALPAHLRGPLSPPPYFSNAYLPLDRRRSCIYLFILLTRAGVKNVAWESLLRPFRPTLRVRTIQYIYFSGSGSSSAGTSGCFHDPFSLSVFGAIFDPTATRLREPWAAALPPEYFLANWYFLRHTRVWCILVLCYSCCALNCFFFRPSALNISRRAFVDMT